MPWSGSGAYLLGPASGAGLGVGPGSIGVGIGTGMGMGMMMRAGVGEGEEILDLDGVPVRGDDGSEDDEEMLTEPNSPDKFGEGMSLPVPSALPER